MEKANYLMINNNERNELKNFLKVCEYILPANVYVNNQNGRGYYGMSLKFDENLIEKKRYNGKIIEKINVSTNNVVATYNTIAKAAESEKISTATLSRCIKSKKIIDNHYFCEKM